MRRAQKKLRQKECLFIHIITYIIYKNTKDFHVSSEDSSQLLTMSEKISDSAPVGSLLLQAYPMIYFLVTRISSTDGFEWSHFERIKEMPPLALQPCVWNLKCCTRPGWYHAISRRSFDQSRGRSQFFWKIPFYRFFWSIWFWGFQTVVWTTV